MKHETNRKKKTSSKIEKECAKCGEKFESYVSAERIYCSRKCSLKFGEENPSFGGKLWNDDRKRNWSEQLKAIYKERPELREISGSANRGKKFSRERIDRMWKNRAKRPRRIMSDVTRQKIGAGSKAKFTDEYKQRMRNANIARGIYIPDSLKDEYSFYKELSNWKRSMWDLVDGGISLLREHGIMNSSTNPNGVVRDHIVSRMNGWKAGVFPEIIRHPANCQILTNKQNIKKESDSWLTLEELFVKIQHWQKDWYEHQHVLDLIEMYRDGKRYDKNTYTRD